MADTVQPLSLSPCPGRDSTPPTHSPYSLLGARPIQIRDPQVSPAPSLRFPSETETIVVQAPPDVRGFLGDNATLQCKLHTQEHNVQVTLVTWMRQDLEGRPRSVAVFHPTRGPSFPSHPSFPEPGRLEFVAARPGVELLDATLAVRGLRAEDEANYTCHFATFPQGSRSASTRLRVLGERGRGTRKGGA